VGKSTVELYCDLDGLQAPGGGSIPANVMVQAQRPDLVIVDRSVYGRFRIALVELTCPWDTDAKKAEEWKTAGCLSDQAPGQDLKNHVFKTYFSLKIAAWGLETCQWDTSIRLGFS
jgi:hypothetical protein